jgi:hypothetical protein
MQQGAMKPAVSRYLPSEFPRATTARLTEKEPSPRWSVALTGADHTINRRACEIVISEKSVMLVRGRGLVVRALLHLVQLLHQRDRSPCPTHGLRCDQVAVSDPERARASLSMAEHRIVSS